MARSAGEITIHVIAQERIQPVPPSFRWGGRPWLTDSESTKYRRPPVAQAGYDVILFWGDQ